MLRNNKLLKLEGNVSMILEPMQSNHDRENPNKLNFNKMQRFVFYCQYLYRKIVSVWIEVKQPKTAMAYYELVYVLSRVIKPLDKTVLKSSHAHIVTIFGKFNVRPGTLDAIMVLPSYERPDINYLISTLNSEEFISKRIAFLDIGSDIGTYSVTVGNAVLNRGLKIFSFEPTRDSFNILKKNIKLNGLEKKTTLINVGLSNKERRSTFWVTQDKPGGNKLEIIHGGKHEEIELVTLDGVMHKARKQFDVAVIKLDVEGHEVEVLRGGKVFLCGIDSILLVEDFGNANIVQFLDQSGWIFFKKVTTYNSWWVRRQSPIRNQI